MHALRLGVNIDHVATLRQARYATMPDSKNAEPDPVAIAGIREGVVEAKPGTVVVISGGNVEPDLLDEVLR